MMLLRTWLVFILFVIALPVRAGTGAVAMPDAFSATAAEQVLRDGGNAVDAAIAATFVLAVTYPEAGNIGGGGFMTSFVDGEPAFLDFRERAPLRARRDMYLDEGGNFQQRLALVGGKAVGVPGTVKGMQLAHERYGTLAWARLLAPAIELAEAGFVVPEALAQMAADKVIGDAGETNFADYFGSMAAGKLFKQPELAATLKLIAADPDAFYSGLLARQLVAQMGVSGGLISLQDMAEYRALWREPIRAHWREFEVLSAPPPSSGGFALVQLLKMRDFAAEHFRDRWHNDAGYVHLLAEIEKRVFADRAEYLGDPDFVQVPLARLLDDDYLKARAAQVNATAISPAEVVPPGLESSDTTHFSILDGAGNAVSLTYTLNWEFGSGVVVAGAGYLLNNQMDDFSAKVGVKNKFGVVGNSNNAIAPGKRMLSSMTPTLLLRDSQPALVIGTPGGSTIFTSVYQVILNLVDFDMPLQQAVDSLRFHHQLPDATLIRHDQWDIPASTLTGLKALGYEVQPNSWGNLGDIQAIAVQAGTVSAAADARGRGVARLVKMPQSSVN
ncbi:gamma-glutamyltranspeptidase [Halioglobus sp. HI00S01]|nr:gamma-glutamyltranspeptidase [Halioglobus sp. HI00S01]